MVHAVVVVILFVILSAPPPVLMTAAIRDVSATVTTIPNRRWQLRGRAIARDGRDGDGGERGLVFAATLLLFVVAASSDLLLLHLEGRLFLVNGGGNFRRTRRRGGGSTLDGSNVVTDGHDGSHSSRSSCGCHDGVPLE